MITEALASYYTRVAERWLVSNNPTNQSNQSELSALNYTPNRGIVAKQTMFSKFIVPEEEQTNVYRKSLLVFE